MGRSLITKFGFDVLVANGKSKSDLEATHDIIPIPKVGGAIRLGMAFDLTSYGITKCHVLVSETEFTERRSNMAWRKLGLTPVAETSVLSRDYSGKQVGDIVEIEKGKPFLVTNVYPPDVSGETRHEPPGSVGYLHSCRKA